MYIFSFRRVLVILRIRFIPSSVTRSFGTQWVAAQVVHFKLKSPQNVRFRVRTASLKRQPWKFSKSNFFHLYIFLADNHFPPSIPEPTPLIHDTSASTRPTRPPSPPLPACCGRLPASVVNKLNKLSVRSGLFKVVGEFGLRENLYYGSIFICMTLIVIVCFLVINNRGGAGLSGLMSGSNAAAYDGGKNLKLIIS